MTTCWEWNKIPVGIEIYIPVYALLYHLNFYQEILLCNLQPTCTFFFKDDLEYKQIQGGISSAYLSLTRFLLNYTYLLCKNICLYYSHTGLFIKTCKIQTLSGSMDKSVYTYH